MICPPQSLKKVLESSGSDYDYSIISRQIIESEKILQPESVERSFAFRWFRDMLPINETTALSDAETKKLVGLPRGTQKLIFRFWDIPCCLCLFRIWVNMMSRLR